MMNAIRKTPDEYRPALAALERFRTLPENWDGAGAPAVSKKVIDRALRTIEVLHYAAPSVPAPRVAAMTDAGIELAWTHPTPRGMLEIEVRFLDEGDALLVGYANVPGFELEEEVHDILELARQVRDYFGRHEG
jgi:hypothetical protein